MLKEFLQRVLPNSGHWFVTHITSDGKSQNVPVASGEYDKIERLVERGNKSKANSYYGVCSFVAPEGRPLGRNRECAELGQFRAIRIDIDCGEGKNYQSFDEAVEAVDAFALATKLPAPLLVSSGRGLHVYFPFTTDVSFAEWSPLAHSLKAACLAKGLRFDDNITQAERLLRLPTSVNMRNGADVIVYDEGEDTPYEVLASTLQPFATSYVSVTSTGLSDRPDFLGKALGNELEAGVGLQDYSAKLAIDLCPALSQMRTDGGKGVDEPMWKKVLDLITGGNLDTPTQKWEQAVLISQGHPSYTESELYSKFAQAAKQKYSPPNCSSIAKPECATCSFKSRVNNPSTLGIPGFASVVPPTAVVAAQPLASKKASSTQLALLDLLKTDNIRFDKGCSVKFGKMCWFNAKEKVETNICEGIRLNSIYREISSGDENTGIIINYSIINDKGQVVQDSKLMLTSVEVAKPDTFLTAVARQSFNYPYSANEKVFTIMNGFIHTLTQRAVNRRKFDQIGWTPAHSFVFGDGVLDSTGTLAPHDVAVGMLIPGDAREPVYGTKGDKAVQLKAVNSMLVTDEAHLIVALGLASPLIHHSPFNGAMVSMYSKDSGVGKTALLTAVASLWGNPRASFVASQSTAAAVSHLLGMARSVPVPIDEVTVTDEKFIADLLLTVSTGKGKDRMTREGTGIQARNTAWETLVFVTTNNPVAESARRAASDSDSRTARLMEITMPPLPVDKVVGNPDLLLAENYGFIGRDYVVALMQQDFDYWRVAIQEANLVWGAELGIDPVAGPHRFRGTLCAIAAISATIGKRIGLNLDVDAIARAVAKVCADMSADDMSQRVTEESLLANFFQENTANIGRLEPSSRGGYYANPLSRSASHGEVMYVSDGELKPLRVASVHIPVQALRKYAELRKTSWTHWYKWLCSGKASSSVGEYMFMNGTPLSYRSPAIRVDTSYVSSFGLTVASPVVDIKTKRK